MMTMDEFSELLERIQAEENIVREAGQREYAHDADRAFRNFEEIGQRLRCRHCGHPIGRENVLMVYLLKHIDGIIAWVNGHRSQREDVRGRLKDARMYEALLWGMAEEHDRELAKRKNEDVLLLSRADDEGL